jgi:hypothetical protein
MDLSSTIFATRYHQELVGDVSLASCGRGLKLKYVLEICDSRSFLVNGHESKVWEFPVNPLTPKDL